MFDLILFDLWYLYRCWGMLLRGCMGRWIRGGFRWFGCVGGRGMGSRRCSLGNMLFSILGGIVRLDRRVCHLLIWLFLISIRLLRKMPSMNHSFLGFLLESRYHKFSSQIMEERQIEHHFSEVWQTQGSQNFEDDMTKSLY